MSNTGLDLEALATAPRTAREERQLREHRELIPAGMLER
jgi:hypothetical protein